MTLLRYKFKAGLHELMEDPTLRKFQDDLDKRGFVASLSQQKEHEPGMMFVQADLAGPVRDAE